jgi:hypothetical protein
MYFGQRVHRLRPFHMLRYSELRQSIALLAKGRGVTATALAQSLVTWLWLVSFSIVNQVMCHL